MNTLFIWLDNDTSFTFNLQNDQLSALSVSVQSADVGNGEKKDYLSVKYKGLYLFIAPMCTIKHYQLILGKPQTEGLKKMKLGDMTFKQICDFCNSRECSGCPLLDPSDDCEHLCILRNNAPCHQKEILNIEVNSNDKS